MDLNGKVGSVDVNKYPSDPKSGLEIVKKGADNLKETQTDLDGWISYLKGALGGSFNTLPKTVRKAASSDVMLENISKGTHSSLYGIFSGDQLSDDWKSKGGSEGLAVFMNKGGLDPSSWQQMVVDKLDKQKSATMSGYKIGSGGTKTADITNNAGAITKHAWVDADNVEDVMGPLQGINRTARTRRRERLNELFKVSKLKTHRFS